MPESVLTAEAPVKCSSCGTLQYTEIYPAVLEDGKKGKKAEGVIADEDSSCFYHPDKVATVACESCGVYLCNLCDLEVEGRHLCPKCFKDSKDQIHSFKNQAVLYDDIVLTVAALSTVIIYFAVIGAPFVIIFTIMKWNKVDTPYKRRTKLKFTLALLLAILQISLIILAIVVIAVGAMS